MDIIKGSNLIKRWAPLPAIAKQVYDRPLFSTGSEGYGIFCVLALATGPGD